jgi:hypothetical protein
MSEQFADLVFLALDHGIESIREAGPLVPFAIYHQDGKREIHRFVTESLEDGPVQARHAVAALPPSVSAYAIAYDGFVTIQGTKYAAILVEASERGKPQGIIMAQRYSPKKFFRKLQTIGNAAHIGHCETLLR